MAESIGSPSVDSQRDALDSARSRRKMAVTIFVAGVALTLKSILLPDASMVASETTVSAHEAEASTTPLSPEPVDFMTLALERARLAKAGKTDTGGGPGHTCPELPAIDPATAPDMTTAEGWLEATNMLRASEQVGPLRLNPNLALSATAAANDLTEAAAYQHTVLGDYIGAYERRWRLLGENLGLIKDQQTDNVAQMEVFVCLADSKGHLENMINPDFTEMGVSIDKAYPDNSALGKYGLDVIHFAKISGS